MFLDQLQELVSKVESLKAKDTKRYPSKSAAKRQGDTSGDEYKHWLRAKFFQQYRPFFRFHKTAKVIVLAGGNDDQTLPADDSKSDAYRVFAKMLGDGNPADSWDALLREARSGAARADGLIAGAGKLLAGKQAADPQ